MITAVIVGGGVGGLSIAAAACKHFDRVTLVDKDNLLGARVADETIEQTKKRRSGVAQYTEPHILLAGGAAALETLVPGFKDEIVSRGALPYDAGQGFRVFDFGSAFPRGTAANLQVISASRKLINETWQDVVIEQAGEKLTVKDRTKVTGLVWDESTTTKNGKLPGVRGIKLDSGEQILADVVFICGGRRSQLPQWLKEGGVAVRDQIKVDCKMNYASRWMKLPEGFDPSKECYAAVTNGRPLLSRGGLFLALENGHAQFCMTGFEGERAPLDHEGWMEYAASLPDKYIHDLAQQCEPDGPITRFASAPNSSYEYWKTKLPEGLVIMGDAAMALNPVYGQGMTVAAQSAVQLDAHLKCLLASKSTHLKKINAVRGAAQIAVLHKKLHKSMEIAWQMSTSEDMRWASVVVKGVPRPPHFLYKYLDSVWLAAQKDVKVWNTMLRVAQFVDNPTKMFSGRVMRKAMRYMFRSDKKNKAQMMEGAKAAVQAHSSVPSESVESSVDGGESAGGKDIDVGIAAAVPIRAVGSVAA